MTHCENRSKSSPKGDFLERKGMTMLEYSLVVACVIAAMFAMQIYFKRALSFRWKEAGDIFGYGRQYGGFGVTTVTKNY